MSSAQRLRHNHLPSEKTIDVSIYTQTYSLSHIDERVGNLDHLLRCLRFEH